MKKIYEEILNIIYDSNNIIFDYEYLLDIAYSIGDINMMMIIKENIINHSYE